MINWFHVSYFVCGVLIGAIIMGFYMWKVFMRMTDKFQEEIADISKIAIEASSQQAITTISHIFKKGA